MSSVKRVSGDYTIQSIGATDTVNVDSPFVNINGNLTVTGNAVLVGNINADRIFNGTTSVEIPSPGSDALVNVGGTSNVVVWKTTGEYVTGIVSASGNVTGGNIRTAGQVSATGNVSGGNVTVSSGNIVLTQTSGATTSQMIRFQDANTAVTTLGANIGAIEWYTSDGTGAGDRITARIQAVYADINGNANIQIQTGSSATPTTRITVVGATGNVGIGNATPLDTLAVTGTTYVSGNIVSAANIAGANLVTAGLATISGNVIGGNLVTAGVATITGNVTGGNIISVGVISAGASGISTTGNIVGGNVNSDDRISATGNITGANIVGVQNIYTTGNVNTANINVSTIMNGTGIGVENIVWQSVANTVIDGAGSSNIGVLAFQALAGYSYKWEAYLPVIPAGAATTTAFATYFDGGTCNYTLQTQINPTNAFAVATSNTSDSTGTNQNMTGTTLRTVMLKGTFYHSGNANVAIRASTSGSDLTVQSGAYLTYTRIG